MPIGYANAGPTSKLQYHFIGLFKILCIQSNAAKLNLSRELGIYPVVNVSKLKPDCYNPNHSTQPLPPLWHIAKTATGVYEIDKITNHQ